MHFKSAISVLFSTEKLVKSTVVSLSKIDCVNLSVIRNMLFGFAIYVSHVPLVFVVDHLHDFFFYETTSLKFFHKIF